MKEKIYEMVYKNPIDSNWHLCNLHFIKNNKDLINHLQQFSNFKHKLRVVK